MPRFSTKFQSSRRAYAQPTVRSERAFTGTQPLTPRPVTMQPIEVPKKKKKSASRGGTPEKLTAED